MASTRLSTDQYIEYFDRDITALIDAATDGNAAVPGCPEWTVNDLVTHLTGVYRHKVVVLDTNSPGPKRDSSWGLVSEGEDPLVALATAHSDVRRRLVERSADAPTWAWWPADQTVGFWQRRMAQETAVHRWDVQSATRGVDKADPLPSPLANDGIDELLTWLTMSWHDAPQPDADGHTVSVATEDFSWTISLHPTEVHLTDGDTDAQAALTGEAGDVLLHLWGRPDGGRVTSAGDPLALHLLRGRLSMIGS